MVTVLNNYKMMTMGTSLNSINPASDTDITNSDNDCNSEEIYNDDSFFV